MHILISKSKYAILEFFKDMLMDLPHKNFKNARFLKYYMEYDLNRPWLTLDPWQKEYCFDPDPNQDNFLLTCRQDGKTTAMSIRAVELCINHYKKGEFVLINSITEKQAYHMLAKAMVYAQEKYSKLIKKNKEDKPTKHRIMFKNGTGILCHAAGETGEGLRGFTIKKLMPDEGSRMSEEYFIATMPMLSVIGGSMDIASTPNGKLHKDGTEKFFYKCSKDPKFKKYYINADECPRHSKKFLATCKERLSKLAYAQEYMAVFTDELKRLFDDNLLKKICVLKRKETINRNTKHYLGVDIAGFGKDDCTFEGVEKFTNGFIEQTENIIEKRNFTTDTTKRIIQLNRSYNYRKIGVDDGGIGFGVYSELMQEETTKRITDALNNSSRKTTFDGKKSKKILKEDMYMNLLSLMENNKIKLLDDDEVKLSLESIQHEDEKIFGSYSHITEGIIRAVWEAEKDKSLNIYIY